jgi:hypothetical protein
MRKEDYQRQKKAVKVLLETADGKTIEAELMIFHGDSVTEVMNGRAEFLELHDSSGKSSLVAKSFIRRIFPKADEEQERRENTDLTKLRLHANDPYLVLDVPSQASDEDVRLAYHKLARAYHPDKLAALDLPPAIRDYGEEILKKINAAYEMIMFQRRKSGTA